MLRSEKLSHCSCSTKCVYFALVLDDCVSFQACKICMSVSRAVTPVAAFFSVASWS